MTAYIHYGPGAEGLDGPSAPSPAVRYRHVGQPGLKGKGGGVVGSGSGGGGGQSSSG